MVKDEVPAGIESILEPLELVKRLVCPSRQYAGRASRRRAEVVHCGAIGAGAVQSAVRTKGHSGCRKAAICASGKAVQRREYPTRAMRAHFENCASVVCPAARGRSVIVSM